MALPAQGIKSCGIWRHLALQNESLLPFSPGNLGSSRQDGQASETLWGGGGRSVFVLLSREVGVTQLPWKFLFLALRQLEPVRLPGNKKQDLRAGEGKTQTVAGCSRDQQGWREAVGWGSPRPEGTRLCADTSSRGCCHVQGQGVFGRDIRGDAQIPGSQILQTTGPTGAEDRRGFVSPLSLWQNYPQLSPVAGEL